MPHNGGRVQINCSAPYPYDDWAFLNACKMQIYQFRATLATEDWRLLYDARGYPTRMASGVGSAWLSSQLWIYGGVGEIWVLDWPGTATIAMTSATGGFTFTESIISSNRREYTITANGGSTFADGSANPVNLVLLTISSMSANTFAGGEIRLYLKSNESRVAAGEVFDPNFLSRVRGFGVNRFMDWMMQTGGSDNNMALWSQRRPSDSYSYFGQRLDSTLWCSGAGTNGASTGTNDQVVNQPSDPVVSWTNGRSVQWLMEFAPIFRTPSAATNANPVEFTDAGHPYLTGDQIEVASNFGTWKILSSWDPSSGGAGASFRTFTCTKIDANRYTLDVDTSALAAYPGIQTYKQVTLKVGALAAVPVRRAGGANHFSTEFAPAAADQGFTNGYMTATYDSALGCLLGTGDSMRFMEVGVPVEIMVALANTCGAHPWFTFGFLWTDDAITQFATYVRDNLNTGLIPRFEWGNECWNSSNWGTTYANNRGFLESAVGNSFNFNIFYGYRTLQCGDLVAAVYLGSGKTYKMGLMFQAAQRNSTITTDRFQCPPYSAGDPAKYPINHCQTAGYNGYWEPAFQFAANTTAYPGYVHAVYQYTLGGSDRRQAFDFMMIACRELSADPTGYPSRNPVNFYRDTIGPFWATAVSSYAGVTLTEYEAGNSVFGSNTIIGGFPAIDPISGVTVTVANVRSFWTDFLLSSQCAALVLQHARDFINLGGEFPSQFTVADNWQNGVNWGLYRLNSFSAGPTIQYSTLLNYNSNFIPSWYPRNA